MIQPALRLERSDDGAELRLSGALSIETSGTLWRELLAAGLARGERLTLDLSGVPSVDGAAAAILLAVRGRARANGGEVELANARPEVSELLELYGCPTEHECLHPAPREAGLIEGVGDASARFAVQLRDTFNFLGDLIVAVGGAFRQPRSVQWADVPRLSERTGADGVPIVLLINFLVGAIIALQASYQLARFGASVFVADLVGLSITRELAPLMTAIIVAGRSGAAFAAELGTMRVSEEIDALRVMGFDPVRHLVFPRALALALVMPLLTIGADVVGCLGGLVVAVTQLELGIDVYMAQLREAVGLWDVVGGLLKSVVFAVTITLISCQRGLWTRGGAAGVGSSTTSAVVTILFALIVWDAVFTMLFSVLGI